MKKYSLPLVLLVFSLFILVAWKAGADRPGEVNSPPDPPNRAVVPQASATPSSSPTVTLAPTLTPTPTLQLAEFDGERALRDVHFQVDLGPRTVGSPAHSQLVEWLVDQLRLYGWTTHIQETEMLGKPVRNVIARWGEGEPWVVLGAHYDSRLVADNDPDPQNQALPVPGGNDGASGVAVLLEMARILPQQLEARGESARFQQVWLVFFDAEDNGRIPGWDWILGSRAFVQSLNEKPDAAVIVDMIGDADLNVYQEGNSDGELTRQIWEQAARLGYEEYIIPEPGHTILDDHVPFMEAGIPAVDLIDIDYPYWHTLEDTADKVSARSLEVIGETLLAWLRADL